MAQADQRSGKCNDIFIAVCAHYQTIAYRKKDSESDREAMNKAQKLAERCDGKHGTS